MNDDNNNEKNEKSINKSIDTINEKSNTKNNDKKTNTKNNDKNIKIVIKNDKKVNSSNTKTNTATATSTSTTTTTSSTIDKNNIVQTNKKRIPKIAISMFGRGKIIGESEVFKDLSNFEFSYEIATIGTELLLMPATVFREAMSADHFKQSDAYKIIQSNSINNSLINNTSTNSINTIKQTNDMMKNFIIDDKSELRARNQVDVALPTLLNQPTTSTTSLKSSSFSINNSNSNSNSALSVSSLVEKHLKNVQASMMTNSIISTSSTSPTAAIIKAKFSTLPVSIATSSTNTTTPSTPPTISTNASTTITTTSSASPSSTTLKISPSPPINNNSNKKKNSTTLDKTSPRKIIGGFN